METFIVILIVALAVAYVSRNIYRQFKGKGGCSSGCACSEEVKHNCNTTPHMLDNNK